MSRTHADLLAEYNHFLQQENVHGRIQTTLEDKAPRLHIRFSEIRSHDAELAEELRTDPLRHIRALEAAATSIAQDDFDEKNPHLPIGIEGPLHATASNPRQLVASSLRHLVCVQGVATKVSDCKPKVVASQHFCPATGQSSSRKYVDATDPQLGLPEISDAAEELPDRYIQLTNAVYPTKDDQDNPLETEYGLSEFKDYQTISLQEMPETAPLGQLPRSVELVLDRDWVDRIKPGDRVAVTGVYRALSAPNRTHSFPTAILVSHVQLLGRSAASSLQFSPEDIGRFRELSQRPNILQLVGQSIAPSIHGHARIKQAIALQLLAGREKNLENGTHLRGDINILLVGDPSTAKSQLLRAAMQLAPLAVTTTGKGSSGVGLTAAVTSDPDTKERRLEAGAMVLADRGLVCVDEFDKLSEADRVALHEAMEQQTVTIAKAGIHASLNARCAVLAAANPVYGQYDKSQRVTENVGLPDSLLSRFDLLFIVLDQMDAATDRRVAAHVLQSHRQRHEVEDAEDDAPNRMWDIPESTLSLPFLRKYLHYAKTCRKPALTDAVRDVIVARYAELRASPSALAVTARSLETIIRLATAHAKVRLNMTVDVQDVNTALEIVRFALFHEDLNGSSSVAADENLAPEEDSDDDDDDEDGGGESPAKRQRTATSSADASPLQKRIWDLLDTKDGVAETELPALLDTTSSSLEPALNELEEQGKIQRADGDVWKI